MRTFDEIWSLFAWREIRGCPGRYIARNIPAHFTVGEILGSDVPEKLMRSDAVKDEVIVTRLEKGGLISYKRDDGRYVHTLNTESGFKRKLTALGFDGN